MNEIQVIINQTEGEIQFNYDEVKSELQSRMELYKDAYFTEESKAMAKKEVAALRKIKDAIDKKRKEVKEQCFRPYKEFEDKAKELMALIDEPIALIDGQVKAFEEKRKQERRENIKSIYESSIGDMAEYISLEKIYNVKWENASTSMKSIREEMEGLISSSSMAVDTIRSMTSDKVEDALGYYKNTLDVAGAIKMINDYERQKAEIVEREQKRREEQEVLRRQQEEERIRQEERRRVAEEERIRTEEREKVKREIEKEAVHEAASGFFDEGLDDLPFEQPSTITAFYKIVATPEELERVEMAFNSIGIYFERRDA